MSQRKVVFQSDELSLDLRYIVDSCAEIEGLQKPAVDFKELDLSARVSTGRFFC